MGITYKVSVTDGMFSPLNLAPKAWYRADTGITLSNFWTQVNNLTVSDSSVTKTSADAWDGWTMSGKCLTGEGYVEFTVNATNKYKRFSLIRSYARQGSNVNFGVYIDGNDGTIQVHEVGVIKHDHTAVSVNDVIRIAVSAAGVVTYKKNGTTFYTSATTATFPLVLELLLYHNTDSINSIVISGPTGRRITGWSDLSGNGKHLAQYSNEQYNPYLIYNSAGRPVVVGPAAASPNYYDGSLQTATIPTTALAYTWLSVQMFVSAFKVNNYYVYNGTLYTAGFGIYLESASNRNVLFVHHSPGQTVAYSESTTVWDTPESWSVSYPGSGSTIDFHIANIHKTLTYVSIAAPATPSGSMSTPGLPGSGQSVQQEELVLLGRAITDTERTQWHAYTKARYGV